MHRLVRRAHILWITRAVIGSMLLRPPGSISPFRYQHAGSRRSAWASTPTHYVAVAFKTGLDIFRHVNLAQYLKTSIYYHVL